MIIFDKIIVKENWLFDGSKVMSKQEKILVIMREIIFLKIITKFSFDVKINVLFTTTCK